MGIEVKGTSPILHGKKNVNGKQKHPVEDFPEEAAAAAAAKGPGKLKQRSYKKGGKVK
tara:strand:+ start:125 stop:298 length:174 start_codon:yes stop_codon:yes gene_type:complete